MRNLNLAFAALTLGLLVLPAAAQDDIAPAAPARDRWIRIGLTWGGSIADLETSRYALAGSHVREGNPFLATATGKLSTGKFLALTIPLDSIMTIATLRNSNSKLLRTVGYVTGSIKFGLAISNIAHR